MKPRPMNVEVVSDSGGMVYVAAGRQDEPMHQVGPKFKPQERSKAQRIAARLTQAFVGEGVEVAPVVTIPDAKDLQVAIELEAENTQDLIYDSSLGDLDSAQFEYLEALLSIGCLDDQIQLDANQALAVTGALRTALETAEDVWDEKEPGGNLGDPQQLREYGRRLQIHGYLMVGMGPALSDYSVSIGTEMEPYMIYHQGKYLGYVNRVAKIYEFVKTHQQGGAQ